MIGLHLYKISFLSQYHCICIMIICIWHKIFYIDIFILTILFFNISYHIQHLIVIEQSFVFYVTIIVIYDK